MIANPTAPIDTHAAAHYTWGGDCDGWHLLRTDALSVIQERMPAGRAEVRHRHARAEQFFFVLSGVLTLEVEGTRHRIPPRTGLHVPAGAAHQALNEGDVPTEFLVVSRPPSHGDREAAPPPPRG